MRFRHVPHWATWADTIKMVHERHPEVAESILEVVEARTQAPSIVAINNSVENLVDGVAVCSAPAPVGEEPTQPRVGGSRVTSAHSVRS